MENLTTKELTALEDQIGCEEMLVKKYETMAGMCADANIRREFEDIAQRHRGHFNSLVGFLQ